MKSVDSAALTVSNLKSAFDLNLNYHYKKKKKKRISENGIAAKDLL